MVRNISCETASVFDLNKRYSVKCVDDSSFTGAVYGCPKNNGSLTSDSPICLAAKMMAIPLESPFTLVGDGVKNTFSNCTMNEYTSNPWTTSLDSYRIEISKAFYFIKIALTLLNNLRYYILHFIILYMILI